MNRIKKNVLRYLRYHGTLAMLWKNIIEASSQRNFEKMKKLKEKIERKEEIK